RADGRWTRLAPALAPASRGWPCEGRWQVDTARAGAGGRFARLAIRGPTSLEEEGSRRRWRPLRAAGHARADGRWTRLAPALAPASRGWPCEGRPRWRRRGRAGAGARFARLAMRGPVSRGGGGGGG